MGDVRGVVPLLLFSNSQKGWLKVSHAARELSTVFSVTIVGQLVRTPPPKQKLSRHITVCRLTFVLSMKYLFFSSTYRIYRTSIS